MTSIAAKKSRWRFMTRTLLRLPNGIAGLSVVADSLSAIKYAKVKVIRDESGLAVDYQVEAIFLNMVMMMTELTILPMKSFILFMNHIKSNHTYRGGIPTILTITSNVVYGKATGSTPDGRKKGEAFAPGANPMHRRDTHGAVASFGICSKTAIPRCAGWNFKYFFYHPGCSW